MSVNGYSSKRSSCSFALTNPTIDSNNTLQSPPSISNTTSTTAASVADSIPQGANAVAASATSSWGLGLADSGSTGMYFSPQDAIHLSSVSASLEPTCVRTASNQVVSSSHTASLRWPSMPPAATSGHIFPTFGRSLISVPVLADANLTTIFTRRGVFVTRDIGDPSKGDVLIQGGRDSRGLYE